MRCFVRILPIQPVSVFFLCLLLIGLGCSSGAPITPDFTNTAVDVHSTATQPILWGLWDIHIDPESETIEAVPLRGPAFTCNVVQFVDGPPVNLLLSIEDVDPQADYTDILIDVGLQHPFPGLDQYTGFDVLGVFMGDGTSVYLGPDGFPVAGESDQQLLNADGYTRWFNADEFTDAGETMPLFGYVPGKLGTPDYIPSAVLNPYKYFADGLEKDINAFDFLVNNADDRGCFRPGSVNRRYYNLRFPTPTPGITFQYAVIANWDIPENGGASLDDFPISANAAEAVVISVVDNSTLYYVDATEFGGNVVLDISVYDWSATCSGVMEEYVVKCFSDAWTGDGAVDMTPVDSGTNYYTFQTDIPFTSMTAENPLLVWIRIDYPGLDYSNEFGVKNGADGSLASFYKLGIPVSDQAPITGWALTWGGGDDDFGRSVAIGGSGAIYATGAFEGTVDFDPGDGTEIHSSCGNTDFFLTRFDSSGDFEWVRVWGGTFSYSGWGVAADDDDNAYVTGYATAYNGKDIFLRKYNSNGDLVYNIAGGGMGTDSGATIALDGSGYFYMTGWFSDTVDDHTAVGEQDVFLRKYDVDCNLIWTQTWGGTLYDRGYGVSVDGVGDIYVLGNFYETVDFDPDPIDETERTALGEYDIFVSKFDPSGDFQWVGTWGGGGHDQGFGVVVDENGNSYSTGYFHGTVDFDPGPGNVPLTSNGWSDVFVNKLDSNGDFLWACNWGEGIGYSITMQSSEYIYVAGTFEGTVDFDPGAGYDPHLSSGNGNAFVSKFDSSGDFQWARDWGGGYTSDCAFEVAADSSGNSYTIGFFKGAFDFDPSGEIDEHSSNGVYDIFLSKFLPDGSW